MVKSRFRRKVDRKIRNVVVYILLHKPLSFFTRSRFTRTRSVIYFKNKKTASHELIFDRLRLQATATEIDRISKEHFIIKKVERNDVAKQYQYFISLMFGCNFFNAHSDTHYSYEGDVVPDPEITVQYEFALYWRWNGKSIYSIEMIDNTYYGISEEDREKFAVLEEYLIQLEMEVDQNTKNTP